MFNALLSMAEKGHALDQRMSRGIKNGLLHQVLEQLKDQMNIPPEALSLDRPNHQGSSCQNGRPRKRNHPPALRKF